MARAHTPCCIVVYILVCTIHLKFGGGSLFANFFVGLTVSNFADFLICQTGTVRAQAAVFPQSRLTE